MPDSDVTQQFHAFFDKLRVDIQKRDSAIVVHAYNLKKKNKLTATSPLGGTWFSCVFPGEEGRKGNAAVQLVIDSANREDNQKLFAELQQMRDELQIQLGQQLAFHNSSGGHGGVYVEVLRPGSILDSATRLASTRGWMADTLVAFNKAISSPQFLNWQK